MPSMSLGSALRILKDYDNIASTVRPMVRKNLSYMVSHTGRLRFYKKIEPVSVPVTFVDYSSYTDAAPEEVCEYLWGRGCLCGAREHLRCQWPPQLQGLRHKGGLPGGIRGPEGGALEDFPPTP